MIHVFNTATLDHEYTTADLKPGGLHPLADYGLDASFYGGRVRWIGETAGDVLLLIDAQMNLVDTAAERLDSIPRDVLKRLAASRGISLEGRPNTERMVELLTR